jgi:hypothetical protein
MYLLARAMQTTFRLSGSVQELRHMIYLLVGERGTPELSAPKCPGAGDTAVIELGCPALEGRTPAASVHDCISCGAPLAMVTSAMGQARVEGLAPSPR